MRTAIQLCLAAFMVLTSGCAAIQGPAGSEKAVSQPRPAAEESKEAVFKPVQPEGELTPSVLYQLLVAEVAGQRGQLDVAVVNYLAAAEASRDAGVAERATRRFFPLARGCRASIVRITG